MLICLSFSALDLIIFHRQTKQVSVLASYPLASRQRPRIYGYKISKEFLVEFAKAHDLYQPDNIPESQYEALRKILHDCRIKSFNTCRERGVRGSPICLCIGHNSTQRGLDMATPEKIERVKRVLGVTEDPIWLIPDTN